MKSCNSEWEALLPAYLDGELSASQREDMERHLEGCAHCRQELEAFRKDDRLLRAAIGTPAPVNERIIPGVWAELERESAERQARRAPKREPERPSVRTRSPFSFPRIWGFAGALAVAAFVLMVLFNRHVVLGPMDVQIASVEGDPLWRSSDSSAWLPLKVGMALHSGDSFKTGPGGKVTAVWKDGTRAALGPNGESSLLHLFPGVELKTGGLWAKVRKRQSQETPFTVRAPEATAQVMGTEFVVELKPGQPVMAVRVMEGAVHLFNASGSVTVREWMTSNVKSNAAPGAPQAFSPLSSTSAWWL
jgi:ferric-dicitrate binding protein FerR (iron transport regulator)